MNIDKWKKKPLKKELYDIIKLQEERISKLNKEKAHIEIAYEEDYKEQQQEIERLHSIIKEVREYIEERYNGEVLTHTFDKDNVGELLEILDKVD